MLKQSIIVSHITHIVVSVEQLIYLFLTNSNTCLFLALVKSNTSRISSCHKGTEESFLGKAVHPEGCTLVQYLRG